MVDFTFNVGGLENMSQYHIVGRSGAGSLIIEFLFREAGVDYGISFPSPSEVKKQIFMLRIAGPNPNLDMSGWKSNFRNTCDCKSHYNSS